MKFSIVMPAFNVEAYIEESIQSILDQTESSFELIIVNDGSTDNTAEVVKQYAVCDSRIRLIEQANGGLSAARNAGLKVARGEFIYFMDSDDLLVPHALNCLGNALGRCNTEIVFFAASSFYDSGYSGNYQPNYERPEFINLVSGANFFEATYPRKMFHSSACLYATRRTFLENTGLHFPVGILHEDEAFTLRLCLRAKLVVSFSEVFFLRRVRVDSIMTRPSSIRNVEGYLFASSSILSDLNLVKNEAHQYLVNKSCSLFQSACEKAYEISDIQNRKQGLVLCQQFFLEHFEPSKFGIVPVLKLLRRAVRLRLPLV